MSNADKNDEKMPEGDKNTAPTPAKPKPTPKPSDGSPLRKSLDDLDD